MGREEQIEEREVLESIFPEEITGLFYSSLLGFFHEDWGNVLNVPLHQISPRHRTVCR